MHTLGQHHVDELRYCELIRHDLHLAIGTLYVLAKVLKLVNNEVELGNGCLQAVVNDS